MKVAVVGSGVSGLAATWLLNEHSPHEVHLYEADARPGGHANTVRFVPPGNDAQDGVDVDTGFILFNPKNYPNFLRFIQRNPQAEILPIDSTFSVSRDDGLFEWAGSNLMAILRQPSRLLDPSAWRLVYDVMRFNACAHSLVMGWSKGIGGEMTIGEYLKRERYSDTFRDNSLIPMTAAIWSAPRVRSAMDVPARTVIQFLYNHRLLQLVSKPSWMTIKGGSHSYVNSILGALPASQLHFSTSVTALSSDPTGSSVRLTTADGESVVYDHVILACHSDAALAILRAGEGLTEDEETILSRFKWKRNEAILHSDTRFMPKDRKAWACWNYRTSSVVDARGQRKSNLDDVTVTYGMNNFQQLPESKYGPILVTLNAPFEPLPETVVGRYHYDHPVLDSNAVLSQREMHKIQNKRRISYAGAFLKFGFHEDGFTSGLNAVLDHSGLPDVVPPFDVRYPDHEPGVVWIAGFFDVFEKSGVRVLLGACFGCLLSTVCVTLRLVGLDIRPDIPAKDKEKAT